MMLSCDDAAFQMSKTHLATCQDKKWCLWGPIRPIFTLRLPPLPKLFNKGVKH